jgi:5'-methylthioadenosine phosphorylase
VNKNILKIIILNYMAKIKIAIIGGSGLDDPQIIKNPEEVNMDTPYGATASPLVCGQIGGADIVILARHGKGHIISPTNVPFRANIWALKEIGCTHVIATTACGSLQEKIRPRDLIFLDQFIDFTKHRNLTFYDDFKDKIVHTPMAEPFCPPLNKILINAAKKLDIPHHAKGTVITIEGPRFSTRAESKFFKNIGADVINMSTVPEVILARELGLNYACVAMATDYDVWRDTEETVSWEMIVNVMKDNANNVKRLLLEAIPNINFNKCENCNGN